MLCIEHIDAFSNNSIRLLYDDQTMQTWVVDPGKANPVIQILSDKGLTLEGVLITHHHYDHVGGYKRYVSNSIASYTGQRISKLAVSPSVYQPATR
jgi:hydroxyacylglutathione hydrolase